MRVRASVTDAGSSYEPQACISRPPKTSTSDTAIAYLEISKLTMTVFSSIYSHKGASTRPGSHISRRSLMRRLSKTYQESIARSTYLHLENAGDFEPIINPSLPRSKATARYEIRVSCPPCSVLRYVASNDYLNRTRLDIKSSWRSKESSSPDEHICLREYSTVW